MPTIKITERDLTSPGDRVSNYDIVYVPGLMTTDTTKFTDVNKAAKKRVPTLCRTVYEFTTAFGEEPFYFDKGTSGNAPSFDLSYLYAKELLSLGIPVLYESLNDTSDTATTTWTADTFTTKLLTDKVYADLKDKGVYQFKYITSGGYSSYTVGSTPTTATTSGDDGDEGDKGADTNVQLYTKMVELARDRGDCIVLIDHDKSAKDVTTIYSDVKTNLINMDMADSSAFFTPWVNINSTTYVPLTDSNGKILSGETTTFCMPPSFAYLSALAKSLRSNPSWLAVAGASRGQIPNLNGETPLNVTKVVTNAIADSLQPRGEISINPITEIKPFGYRIWGNRTLKNNAIEGDLTATSFLNTRSMICDVKKVVYEACRKFTFEQNNDLLWLNFKSYIEPTLNRMQAGAGLSGFKIIKDTTNAKAKLMAKIKLYPIYAVEDFDIEVQMLDEEIKVS